MGVISASLFYRKKRFDCYITTEREERHVRQQDITYLAHLCDVVLLSFYCCTWPEMQVFNFIIKQKCIFLERGSNGEVFWKNWKNGLSQINMNTTVAPNTPNNQVSSNFDFFASCQDPEHNKLGMTKMRWNHVLASLGKSGAVFLGVALGDVFEWKQFSHSINRKNTYSLVAE